MTFDPPQKRKSNTTLKRWEEKLAIDLEARIDAAINGAMKIAYSHKGQSHPGGHFVWSEVYPAFRGQPWCGAFMVYCYRRVGVDLMRAAWWYYVPFIRNFARGIGAYENESSYGAAGLFDWNGDGLMDHVGMSNPDYNSDYFRFIEGNTSSGNAGSQSNGGGVYERYRDYGDIDGFVNMRAVLRWMFQNGKWDGRVSISAKALAPYNPISITNPNNYSEAYVSEIQTALKRYGYDIGTYGVDGVLGWDTYKAIRKFQEDNGLEVDGVPGPLTRSRLLNQETYRDVRAIQRVLHCHADNVVGPETRRHARAFVAASNWGGRTFPDGIPFTQRVVGTEPDGIWGDASEEAHDQTAYDLQMLLGVERDAIWGPVSDAALWMILDQGEQP